MSSVYSPAESWALVSTSFTVLVLLGIGLWAWLDTRSMLRKRREEQHVQRHIETVEDLLEDWDKEM